MIVGLVAFALASQTGLQLQTGVVRLPDLVAELAGKSGEPLATAANLKNEVVYINLHPRKTPELMSLIAEVSGCEWVRREKRIELTRTLPLQRLDEDIERQRAVESLTRVVKRFPAPTDKIDAKTAETAVNGLKRIDPAVEGNFMKRIQAAGAINPVRRLFYRLLHLGSFDWMASVPSGRIKDFSNTPNRYQKPLPFNLSPTLKTYFDEVSTLLVPLRGQDQASKGARGDVLGFWEEDLSGKRQGPYTVVFTVTRNTPEFIDFKMMLLSASGTTMGSTGMNFPLEADPDEVNPLEGKVDPGYELDAAPIFWAAYKPFLLPKEDREIIDIMRDPVSNEPLKVLLEKPLNSWFAKANMEGIMSLSDQLGSDRYLREKPLLTKPFIDFLRHFESMTVRDGLVVGRPRYPAFSYQSRFDRAIARELISRSPFGLPVGLESLSAYVAKQREGAGMTGLEVGWLSLAIHGQSYLEDLRALGQRDNLRLWTLLTAQQKEIVRNGGRFALSSLSSQALNLVYSMMYERQQLLIVRNGSAPVSVLFPQGLPEDAYFESKTQADPTVIFEAKNGAMGMMSVGTAAYIRFEQEKGEMLNPSSGYPLMDGALMRPVDAQNFNTQLMLSPTASCILAWKDFFFDPSVKAAKGEDLPGPIGDAYRKSLENYRKPPGSN